MTGQDVLGPDGRVVGRLADLTVDLDEQPGPCLVERLLVQRHRAPDLLLPWAAVESFRHTGLVLAHGTDDLATFAITSITDALGDDEILLGRDVLDTQVIDVVGQRLARVADVVLARISQRPARARRRRGRVRRRCCGGSACADWRRARARTSSRGPTCT